MAHKISQEFLDKWIKVIIPEKYWPDKDPEGESPLLGVYLISDKRMEVAKHIWMKVDPSLDTDEDVHMLGQLVNIGHLLTLVGKKAKSLENKYTIRLNEEQTETSLLFSLAHEIGHLEGELNDIAEHAEDPDGYADAYAFRRIKKVIKDERLRARIIYEALVTR